MATISLLELNGRPKDEYIYTIGDYWSSVTKTEFSYHGPDKIILALVNRMDIVGMGYRYNNRLLNLCVSLEYRRKGIGKKIIEKLLDGIDDGLLITPIVDKCYVDEHGEVYISSEALGFYIRHFDVTTEGTCLYRIRRRGG